MKQIVLLFIFILTFSAAVPLAAASACNNSISQKIIQPKFSDFTVSVNGQDVRVNIFGHVSEQVVIEIYSITGQRIATQTTQKQDSKTYEFSLDIPLRKGLYIIKVSSGSQVIAKKFNIQ